MLWLWITLSIAGLMTGVIVTVVLLRRRREIKFAEADLWLLNEFRRCNVMVFGKKGSGKDVLFAHVVAMRGEKHYSNIPYDENTEVIELSEVAAGDNTFEDCINGTIRPFAPRFDEGTDIYISDAGIYFPNTSDRRLNELYPSMPVLFALSRHLYNNNIHTNCQALERPWKKIREQADSYIQVRRTVNRGDHLVVDFAGYDKYGNADAETDPVIQAKVRVPVSELQYDSRYFRQKFLTEVPSAHAKVMRKTIRRVNYDKPAR